MIGNVAAVIMVAVGDARIAVIAAALDQVHLVAAARAHLDLPQPAVGGEGEAERVAVAELQIWAATPPWAAKGLSAGTLPSGLRRRTLPALDGHVLRRRELLALARADEEVAAVGREGEAVAVMAARRRTWAPAARSPGSPSIRAAPLFDRPAGRGPTAAPRVPPVAGLGEAQIDEAVVGEIGVEDDVAEPALAAIIDRRHAGDVDRRAARASTI